MNFSTHKNQLKHMVIGVLMAYAITAIAFLAYAMLVTYTNMSESSLPMVVAITTLLSVIVAGFDAAKGAPKRGWLWGMAAGFLYILIMVTLMAVTLPAFAVDGRTLTTVIIGVAGGGLGGILGINLRK
ncbi:MAG: TIGR04086 family membrane protein [Firmicutes bacterium]|nr:TIGR04086 family membrane protein [Bacillota bacterium]